MKTTNDFFSATRFKLLAQQTYFLNRKAFFKGIAGFCGALFILFLVMQSPLGMRRALEGKHLLEIFITLFVILGLIYIGYAFPAFRSKEKTIPYLMLPASAFEKFVLEYLTRILLFVIVFPFLFLMTYMVEGWLHANLLQDINFYGWEVLDQIELFKHMEEFMKPWSAMLLGVVFWTGINLAFLGSAMFQRLPLLTTIFVSVALFFLYFGLVVLMFFLFDVNSYPFVLKQSSILERVWIAAIILLGIGFNGGLIAAAYYKVKEKEV
ncbi:hypothetical protein [Algivirga pacifica]|uniref:ABC transporter permease n=1 Tax=Algivirga pacifica TaxID=1162670 RepID=A0ABP9DBX8_9BACT